MRSSQLSRSVRCGTKQNKKSGWNHSTSYRCVLHWLSIVTMFFSFLCFIETEASPRQLILGGFSSLRSARQCDASNVIGGQLCLISAPVHFALARGGEAGGYDDDASGSSQWRPPPFYGSSTDSAAQSIWFLPPRWSTLHYTTYKAFVKTPPPAAVFTNDTAGGGGTPIKGGSGQSPPIVGPINPGGGGTPTNSARGFALYGPQSIVLSSPRRHSHTVWRVEHSTFVGVGADLIIRITSPSALAAQRAAEVGLFDFTHPDEERAAAATVRYFNYSPLSSSSSSSSSLSYSHGGEDLHWWWRGERCASSNNTSVSCAHTSCASSGQEEGGQEEEAPMRNITIVLNNLTFARGSSGIRFLFDPSVGPVADDRHQGGGNTRKVVPIVNFTIIVTNIRIIGAHANRSATMDAEAAGHAAWRSLSLRYNKTNTNAKIIPSGTDGVGGFGLNASAFPIAQKEALRAADWSLLSGVGAVASPIQFVFQPSASNAGSLPSLWDAGFGDVASSVDKCTQTEGGGNNSSDSHDDQSGKGPIVESGGDNGNSTVSIGLRAATTPAQFLDAFRFVTPSGTAPLPLVGVAADNNGSGGNTCTAAAANSCNCPQTDRRRRGGERPPSPPPSLFLLSGTTIHVENVTSTIEAESFLDANAKRAELINVAQSERTASLEAATMRAAHSASGSLLSIRHRMHPTPSGGEGGATDAPTAADGSSSGEATPILPPDNASMYTYTFAHSLLPATFSGGRPLRTRLDYTARGIDTSGGLLSTPSAAFPLEPSRSSPSALRKQENAIVLNQLRTAAVSFLVGSTPLALAFEMNRQFDALYRNTIPFGSSSEESEDDGLVEEGGEEGGMGGGTRGNHSVTDEETPPTTTLAANAGEGDICGDWPAAPLSVTIRSIARARRFVFTPTQMLLTGNRFTVRNIAAGVVEAGSHDYEAYFDYDDDDDTEDDDEGLSSGFGDEGDGDSSPLFSLPSPFTNGGNFLLPYYPHSFPSDAAIIGDKAGASAIDLSKSAGIDGRHHRRAGVFLQVHSGAHAMGNAFSFRSVAMPAGGPHPHPIVFDISGNNGLNSFAARLGQWGAGIAGKLPWLTQLHHACARAACSLRRNGTTATDLSVEDGLSGACGDGSDEEVVAVGNSTNSSFWCFREAPLDLLGGWGVDNGRPPSTSAGNQMTTFAPDSGGGRPRTKSNADEAASQLIRDLRYNATSLDSALFILWAAAALLPSGSSSNTPSVTTVAAADFATIFSNNSVTVADVPLFNGCPLMDGSSHPQEEEGSLHFSPESTAPRARDAMLWQHGCTPSASGGEYGGPNALLNKSSTNSTAGTAVSLFFRGNEDAYGAVGYYYSGAANATGGHNGSDDDEMWSGEALHLSHMSAHCFSSTPARRRKGGGRDNRLTFDPSVAVVQYLWNISTEWQTNGQNNGSGGGGAVSACDSSDCCGGCSVIGDASGSFGYSTARRPITLLDFIRGRAPPPVLPTNVTCINNTLNHKSNNERNSTTWCLSAFSSMTAIPPPLGHFTNEETEEAEANYWGSRLDHRISERLGAPRVSGGNISIRDLSASSLRRYAPFLPIVPPAFWRARHNNTDRNEKNCSDWPLPSASSSTCIWTKRCDLLLATPLSSFFLFSSPSAAAHVRGNTFAVRNVVTVGRARSTAVVLSTIGGLKGLGNSAPLQQRHGGHTPPCDHSPFYKSPLEHAVDDVEGRGYGNNTGTDGASVTCGTPAGGAAGAVTGAYVFDEGNYNGGPHVGSASLRAALDFGHTAPTFFTHNTIRIRQVAAYADHTRLHVNQGIHMQWGVVEGNPSTAEEAIAIRRGDLNAGPAVALTFSGAVHRNAFHIDAVFADGTTPASAYPQAALSLVHIELLNASHRSPLTSSSSSPSVLWNSCDNMTLQTMMMSYPFVIASRGSVGVTDGFHGNVFSQTNTRSYRLLPSQQRAQRENYRWTGPATAVVGHRFVAAGSGLIGQQQQQHQEEMGTVASSTSNYFFVENMTLDAGGGSARGVVYEVLGGTRLDAASTMMTAEKGGKENEEGGGGNVFDHRNIHVRVGRGEGESTEGALHHLGESQEVASVVRLTVSGSSGTAFRGNKMLVEASSAVGTSGWPSPSLRSGVLIVDASGAALPPIPANSSGHACNNNNSSQQLQKLQQPTVISDCVFSVMRSAAIGQMNTVGLGIFLDPSSIAVAPRPFLNNTIPSSSTYEPVPSTFTSLLFDGNTIAISRLRRVIRFCGSASLDPTPSELLRCLNATADHRMYPSAFDAGVSSAAFLFGNPRLHPNNATPAMVGDIKENEYFPYCNASSSAATPFGIAIAHANRFLLSNIASGESGAVFALGSSLYFTNSLVIARHIFANTNASTHPFATPFAAAVGPLTSSKSCPNNASGVESEGIFFCDCEDGLGNNSKVSDSASSEWNTKCSVSSRASSFGHAFVGNALLMRKSACKTQHHTNEQCNYEEEGVNIQHGNLYNSHDLRPHTAFGYCNHIPSSSETSFDAPLDHSTAESNNLLVPRLMNECPTTNGPPLYVPINSKGQPVALSWQRDVHGNGGCSAAAAEANATCALDDRLRTIIGEIPPAPHSPSYGVRITVRNPLAIAITLGGDRIEGGGGNSDNAASQQLLCPFCGNGVFVEGILENPTGSGPIASVPVDAPASEKSAAVFIEAPLYVLTSSAPAQGSNDDRNANTGEEIFAAHATIREAVVPPHLLSSLFPLRRRDGGVEVNSSCGHQYGNSSRPSPAVYAYWARHNSLSNRYKIRKIASSSAFPPAEAEEAEAAASARLFDQTFEASSALYFVQKILKWAPPRLRSSEEEGGSDSGGGGPSAPIVTAGSRCPTLTESLTSSAVNYSALVSVKHIFWGAIHVEKSGNAATSFFGLDTFASPLVHLDVNLTRQGKDEEEEGLPASFLSSPLRSQQNETNANDDASCCGAANCNKPTNNRNTAFRNYLGHRHAVRRRHFSVANGRVFGRMAIFSLFETSLDPSAAATAAGTSPILFFSSSLLGNSDGNRDENGAAAEDDGEPLPVLTLMVFEARNILIRFNATLDAERSRMLGVPVDGDGTEFTPRQPSTYLHHLRLNTAFAGPYAIGDVSGIVIAGFDGVSHTDSRAAAVSASTTASSLRLQASISLGARLFLSSLLLPAALLQLSMQNCGEPSPQPSLEGTVLWATLAFPSSQRLLDLGRGGPTGSRGQLITPSCHFSLADSTIDTAPYFPNAVPLRVVFTGAGRSVPSSGEGSYVSLYNNNIIRAVTPSYYSSSLEEGSNNTNTTTNDSDAPLGPAVQIENFGTDSNSKNAELSFVQNRIAADHRSPSNRRNAAVDFVGGPIVAAVTLEFWGNLFVGCSSAANVSLSISGLGSLKDPHGMRFIQNIVVPRDVHRKSIEKLSSGSQKGIGGVQTGGAETVNSLQRLGMAFLVTIVGTIPKLIVPFSGSMAICNRYVGGEPPRWRLSDASNTSDDVRDFGNTSTSSSWPPLTNTTRSVPSSDGLLPSAQFTIVITQNCDGESLQPSQLPTSNTTTTEQDNGEELTLEAPLVTPLPPAPAGGRRSGPFNAAGDDEVNNAIKSRGGSFEKGEGSQPKQRGRRLGVFAALQGITPATPGVIGGELGNRTVIVKDFGGGDNGWNGTTPLFVERCSSLKITYHPSVLYGDRSANRYAAAMNNDISNINNTNNNSSAVISVVPPPARFDDPMRRALSPLTASGVGFSGANVRARHYPTNFYFLRLLRLPLLPPSFWGLDDGFSLYSVAADEGGGGLLKELSSEEKALLLDTDGAAAEEVVAGAPSATAAISADTTTTQEGGVPPPPPDAHPLAPFFRLLTPSSPSAESAHPNVLPCYMEDGFEEEPASLESLTSTETMTQSITDRNDSLSLFAAISPSASNLSASVEKEAYATVSASVAPATVTLSAALPQSEAPSTAANNSKNVTTTAPLPTPAPPTVAQTPAPIPPVTPEVVYTAKSVASVVGVVVSVTSAVSVTGGQLGVANAMARIASCGERPSLPNEKEDDGGEGEGHHLNNNNGTATSADTSNTTTASDQIQGGTNGGEDNDDDDEEDEETIPILAHPLRFALPLGSPSDPLLGYYAAAAISNTIFIPSIVAALVLGPVQLAIRLLRHIIGNSINNEGEDDLEGSNLGSSDDEGDDDTDAPPRRHTVAFRADVVIADDGDGIGNHNIVLSSVPFSPPDAELPLPPLPSAEAVGGGRRGRNRSSSTAHSQRESIGGRSAQNSDLSSNEFSDANENSTQINSSGAAPSRNGGNAVGQRQRRSVKNKSEPTPPTKLGVWARRLLPPRAVLFLELLPIDDRTVTLVGLPSVFMIPYITLAEGIGLAITKCLTAPPAPSSAALAAEAKRKKTIAILCGGVALLVTIAFVGAWLWVMIRLLPRRGLELVDDGSDDDDYEDRNATTAKKRKSDKYVEQSDEQPSEHSSKRLPPSGGAPSPPHRRIGQCIVGAITPMKEWVPRRFFKEAPANAAEEGASAEGVAGATSDEARKGQNNEIGDSNPSSTCSSDEQPITSLPRPPRRTYALVTARALERYNNIIGDKRFFYAEIVSFVCSIAVGAAEGAMEDYDISDGNGGVTGSGCRTQVSVALAAALLQCLCNLTTLIPLELALQALLAVCIVPMSIIVTIKVFITTRGGGSSKNNPLAAADPLLSNAPTTTPLFGTSSTPSPSSSSSSSSSSSFSDSFLSAADAYDLEGAIASLSVLANLVGVALLLLAVAIGVFEMFTSASSRRKRKIISATTATAARGDDRDGRGRGVLTLEGAERDDTSTADGDPLSSSTRVRGDCRHRNGQRRGGGGGEGTSDDFDLLWSDSTSAERRLAAPTTASSAPPPSASIEANDTFALFGGEGDDPLGLFSDVGRRAEVDSLPSLDLLLGINRSDGMPPPLQTEGEESDLFDVLIATPSSTTAAAAPNATATAAATTRSVPIPETPSPEVNGHLSQRVPTSAALGKASRRLRLSVGRKSQKEATVESETGFHPANGDDTNSSGVEGRGPMRIGGAGGSLSAAGRQEALLRHLDALEGPSAAADEARLGAYLSKAKAERVTVDKMLRRFEGSSEEGNQ